MFHQKAVVVLSLDITVCLLLLFNCNFDSIVSNNTSHWLGLQLLCYCYFLHNPETLFVSYHDFSLDVNTYHDQLVVLVIWLFVQQLWCLQEYQAIVDAEWKILYDKLDNIYKSGAKVVLSKLPIGDVATQYFADR